MRLRHFETLRPICPACRRRGLEAPLALLPGAIMADDAVQGGVLRCTATDCARAYPIIAGAPILVPDLPSWLEANLHLVLQGEVDSTDAEAVIGAAMGPDSAFNIVRQQQASYAFDHYGDLDATPDTAADAPGAVRRGLQAALARLPAPAGAVLDIGCAAGRTSFDLAAATDGLVLGLDLNWPLLSIARNVLDHGVVSYPHRRLGTRFERRRSAVAFAGAERVDFWVADALCLPFRPETFSLVTALNVLDCVADPRLLLAEVARLLPDGGGTALATPFDWASHATAPDAWLDGPAALDQALAELNSALLQAGDGALTRTGPAGDAGGDVAWQVRVHDRALIHYRAHLLTAVMAKGTV